MNGDSQIDSAPPSASSLTAFGSSDPVPGERLAQDKRDGGIQPNRQLSRDWMLDDVRNAIALQSDIYLAFDDRRSVIVPKQSKWVIQFLGQTNSLGYNFYNTHIRLNGVAAQFLYARQLLLWLPNGQEVSRSFTFEETKADFVPRSRSVSPRKRKTTNLKEGQFTAKRTCRENDWGTNQVEGSYTATSLSSTCSPESPPQLSLSRQDWVRMRCPTNPT